MDSFTEGLKDSVKIDINLYWLKIARIKVNSRQAYQIGYYLDTNKLGADMKAAIETLNLLNRIGCTSYLLLFRPLMIRNIKTIPIAFAEYKHPYIHALYDDLYLFCVYYLDLLGQHIWMTITHHWPEKIKKTIHVIKRKE